MAIMLIGELEVALDVGQKLDTLGVTWLVGGSVASSILGEPRATADVDLVADLRGRHVGALFAALVDTYTSMKTPPRQQFRSAVHSTSSSSPR
jgi:hypothetical protein